MQASDLIPIITDSAHAAAVAGTTNGLAWWAVPGNVSIATPASVLMTAMATTTTPDLPSGVCATGTLAIESTFSDASNPKVGEGYQAVYTDCARSGMTLNGKLDALFQSDTGWNSPYVLALTYTNWTASYGGSTEIASASFTGLYTYSDGGESFSYVIDGVTVVGQPLMSVSGGEINVISGVAHHFVGASTVDWVSVTFTNWAYVGQQDQPVEGAVADIVGVDGSTAKIVVVVEMDGFKYYKVTIGDAEPVLIKINDLNAS